MDSRAGPSHPERGSRSNRRPYEPIRWLEYSGLLVIIGLLADAQTESLSITDLIDLSGICNDTLYSALSVALSLGLVRLQMTHRGAQPARRYSLTDPGQRLGRIARQARLEMAELPQLRRALASRRAPIGRSPGAHATAGAVLEPEA